jgi:hypothetical protein
MVPANEVSHVWRPVELHGVLYRVLQRKASQFEVEEWTGHFWSPSLLPLYQVRDGRLASVRSLESAGVPSADWVDVRPTQWMRPELVLLGRSGQDPLQ